MSLCPVGISIDSDREALGEYVKNEGITWTNLRQPRKDEPTVVHYSISKFPYHVLVDREGGVTALNPDLETLPSILEELIAPPNR